MYIDSCEYLYTEMFSDKECQEYGLDYCTMNDNIFFLKSKRFSLIRAQDTGKGSRITALTMTKLKC